MFDRAAGRTRVLLVLLALTIAMTIALSRHGASLSQPCARQGVVSLELAFDTATAASIVECWSGSARVARTQVWLDFPFIAAYAAFLFFFGARAARHAAQENWPRFAAAARLAAVGGLLAGGFDVLEDIGLLVTLEQKPVRPAVVLATGICATLKFWLIVGSSAVSTLAAAIAPPQFRPPLLSWGSMCRTARAALGIIILTGLALLLPPQTRDMLAGLSVKSSGGWEAGAAFHFALWVMALSAWHWSRAALSARFEVADLREARAGLVNRTSAPTDRVALDWVPRLFFAAVAGIGVIAALRSAAWLTLLIIAGWAGPTLFLLYHRLALQAHRGREDRAGHPTPRPAPRHSLRALLSHAPLGMAIAWILLALAIGFFVAGAVTGFLPETEWSAAAPLWLGRYFPGPAAALLCLGLAIGPLTALTYWSDQLPLGGRIRGLHWTLRRPPVFSVLVAIVLLAPTFINLHAVRVVPEKPAIGVANRATLDEFFKAWFNACHADKNVTTVRPVIVAISGGASRAGLWGARVLFDVDEAAAGSGTAVFAISSISGGSVGAAAYLATLAGASTAGCRLNQEQREPFHNAAVAAIADDALGPVLAGSLMGDVPRSLLSPIIYPIRAIIRTIEGRLAGELRGGDRAEALERAFAENWAAATTPESQKPRVFKSFDEPFLSLSYDSQGPAIQPRKGPVWVANGTDEETGHRVLTAPFPIGDGPFLGAQDALVALGRDVSIGTAIHNTARFPFLSPAGEVSSAVDGLAKSDPAQLIDGGYFENEGLLTAWELARYLQRYGPGILAEGKDKAAGQPASYTVAPILVQATADAERDIREDAIPRCTPDKASIAAASTSLATAKDETRLEKSRPVQALAPFFGLYNVRGGHSDWILRQVVAEYCSGSPGSVSGQSFFHFYLYRGDIDIPLNWVLSRTVAEDIWDKAPNRCGKDINPGCGNPVESKALRTVLQRH